MIVDQSTLNNVDEYIDSIENQPIVSVVDESKVWEKKYLGKSSTHRLSRIGRDSFNYQSQFIETGNEQKNLIRNDKQKVMDYYFSNTGREMLEMQAVIDEEEKEVEEGHPGDGSMT